MTNDGLVTLKHVGGSTGTQLVPDLSLTLPRATNAGYTYRFEVRSGIRYSTGAVVEPLDFRRAIERAFELGSPGAPCTGGSSAAPGARGAHASATSQKASS